MVGSAVPTIVLSIAAISSASINPAGHRTRSGGQGTKSRPSATDRLVLPMGDDVDPRGLVLELVGLALAGFIHPEACRLDQRTNLAEGEEGGLKGHRLAEELITMHYPGSTVN